MKKEVTKDLTKGSPLRLILFFALPLIMGNLFQQVYNLVDTVIVGRFLGVSQLAAVGSTGSVNFLVIGFVTGCCSGMGIPVAQKFGAGDEKEVRRYVANAFYLAILFSVILTPLMVIFTKNILALMMTPADIIDQAAMYISVIFAGIPCIFLYNLVASVIRALGDSKTPLYFLIISSVVNVVLDIISICVFRMDVMGPALATVISQGCAGIACFFYMKKKFRILDMQEDDRNISTRRMGNLLTIGIPMGLQYSITAIGSVVLQSSVNLLGSVSVAAMTAASRITMVLGNCWLDSLGSAMATYCGQNLGAGKYDRIRDGIKNALFLAIAYSVIGCTIIHLFGGRLAMLFVTDPTQLELISKVKLLANWNSLFFWSLGILAVLRFSIQGLGYSHIAILSGVAEMISRLIVGLIIVPRIGFFGVCTANPLSWGMADLILSVCIFIVMKKIRKMINYRNEAKKGNEVVYS